MAQFTTIKNKIGKKYYYARVESSQWTKHKHISLGTDYKIARERFRIIENDFEKEIKQGVEFESYGWEVGSKGKAKSKKMTIEVLIDKYIEWKKVFVSDSTIKREINSFNLFLKLQGYSCPPNKINNIGKYSFIYFILYSS